MKLSLTAFELHVKLSCSMRIFYPLLFLFSVLMQQAAPVVTAPIAGQTLLGKVDIKGATDVQNFAFAGLAFAYASDSAGNWFDIQTLSRPQTDSVLAVWDTTFISDGDYKLRLRVTLQDGSSQDVIVTDLHVRNYTPDMPTSTMQAAISETPTELPFAPPTLAVITEAPTQPPHPTPTQLSANPASLTTNEIYASLLRGVFIIIGLFIIFGLLTRLRRS